MYMYMEVVLGDSMYLFIKILLFIRVKYINIYIYYIILVLVLVLMLMGSELVGYVVFEELDYCAEFFFVADVHV
jgi:hypothetical protein